MQMANTGKKLLGKKKQQQKSRQIKQIHVTPLKKQETKEMDNTIQYMLLSVRKQAAASVDMRIFPCMG